MIDMDKIARIRQEIERRIEAIAKAPSDNGVMDSINGARGHELMRLLSFLDTISEEPDKGLDVTDFCKPIDPGIAQCVADHWREMLDSKEPDKSLEEAAEEKYPVYWKSYPKDGIIRSESSYDTNKQCRDAFIAGAEWQASQIPMPEDTVLFNKGVAEGRRLEREDMLKDAVEVEGVVIDNGSGGTIIDTQCGVLYLPPLVYAVGEKVRIVVLKEEDE